jgi:hypothetical protein
MSSADKTKLDGIASGATANATDSQLRDRATHTGTQDVSTVTGALSATAAAAAYQPLDSDLTAIASLTTTTFGRDLLTQADAAATRTTIGAGTSNVAISGATPQPLGTAAAGATGEAADAGHVHASPPLVSTSSAGLAPATGEPSGKYLKDDGTWATVEAGASPAGSGTEIQYRDGSALGAIPNSSVDGATGAVTLARLIAAANGAASTPPMALTGTWFTGGTSTTTKPALLIEPTGTTSTAWSTSGTGLGVNAPSGFAGNLLDLQVNGASRFKFDVANKRFHLYTDGTRGDAYFDRGAGGGDPRLVATQPNTFDLTLQGFIRGLVCNQVTADVLSANQDLNPTFRNSYELSSSQGLLLIAIGAASGNRKIIGGTRLGNFDDQPAHFEVRARDRSAGSSSFVNTSGSHLFLAGGAARSAATNQADGGNVNLDSGQGFGTGSDGNIIIGATRGNLEITDARNVILGTTDGTKIGTTTAQKLAFWNATPVAQPAAVADIATTATSGSLPTPDGSVTIADATTPTVTELLEYCVELEAKLEAALGHLRTLGLIAS